MSLPPTGSFRRGGRVCDASPFLLGNCLPTAKLGEFFARCPSFPGLLRKIGYWLRKHRIDMALDSQGPFAYFGCVVGLENP